MTGIELTIQIKKVFGMRDRRNRRSKMGFDFITHNLEHYVRSKALPFRALEVSNGIMWSVRTGRLSADAELAIRHMNCFQYAHLVGMVSDHCVTQGDIPRWLNENVQTIANLK